VAARGRSLAPDNAEVVTAWIVEALTAGDLAEAGRAVVTLSPAATDESAYAQRVLGELARQREDFARAKTHFENAVRLEGALGVNEVPLGLVLLHSTDRAIRARGIALLEKWAPDAEWGTTAIRTLLDYATANDDGPGMHRWADALLTRADRTNADIPMALRSLAHAHPVRYQEVLAALQRDHSVSPEAATKLMAWLNEIGRSSDVVIWMRTLPQDAMKRPPLAVLGAEALRATADWDGLHAWIDDANWGASSEFLRWLYALELAHHRGDAPLEAQYRRSLENYTQLNAARALFAATTLFGWGRDDAAESLGWIAAEQDGGDVTIQALGTLARFYQVNKDADGQFRVFRRWHTLQPQDRNVANNLAYFAALTRREERLAEQLARENLRLDPQNTTYAATLGFVLLARQQAAAAKDILAPFASLAAESPALNFAWGLTLAHNGQHREAQAFLARIDLTDLAEPERVLVKAALDH
jgi:Flp pilus assembly protein TadD